MDGNSIPIAVSVLGFLATSAALLIQWLGHRARDPRLKIGEPATALPLNGYGTDLLQTYVDVFNPSPLPNALTNVILHCFDFRGRMWSASAELGTVDHEILQLRRGGDAVTQRHAFAPGGHSTIHLVFNALSQDQLVNADRWWLLEFIDSRGRRDHRYLAVSRPGDGHYRVRPRKLPLALGAAQRRLMRIRWRCARLLRLVMKRTADN